MSSKALVRCYTKRRRGLRKALPLRVETPQKVFVVIYVDCEERAADSFTVLGAHKTKRGALQGALLNMVNHVIQDDAFYEMFAPTPDELKAREVSDLECNEVWQSEIKLLRKSAAWKAVENYAADPMTCNLESEFDKIESSEQLDRDLEALMRAFETLTDTTHWEVIEKSLSA